MIHGFLKHRLSRLAVSMTPKRAASHLYHNSGNNRNHYRKVTIMLYQLALISITNGKMQQVN